QRLQRADLFEPAGKQLFQVHTQGRYLDAADNVAGERVNEHTASRSLRHAAVAQGEQRMLVEMADRCAVRTLHIICPNLELRPRVDARIGRQQQALVGLKSVGLLRILTHDDGSGKYSGGLPGVHALVQLMALTVRLRVVNRGAVVDVLRIPQDGQAVEQRMHTCSCKQRVHFVTNESAAERKGVRAEPAIPGKRRRDSAVVVGRLGFTLNLVVIDGRALRSDDFGYLVNEVSALRIADVGL